MPDDTRKIDCEHIEKKGVGAFYRILAGETLSFYLCRDCYTMLLGEMTKEILAELATGVVRNALGSVK